MDGKPPKTVLVVEACDGGVGRHVLDLACGLRSLGHSVHVAYSPRRLADSFRQRLHSLNGAGSVLIPMRRNPHPSDLGSLQRLRKYIRQQGPFDIVHGHSSKGGALGRLAARGTGAVSVYTPNALVTLDPCLGPVKRRALQWAERWLARIGDGVIAVSHEEYQHAHSLGHPQDKLFLVPNGIGPITFPPREAVRRSLGLANHHVCVGFVGRLVHQKAPELLIRALAEVAGRFANLRLLLVGTGPLETALRRQASRSGVESQIIWLGERPGPQVMPAFDMFVLPSLYEGLPYVLLEAMACGLPILSTRVGGARFLIQEGYNGYTVPPGDAQALAQAMTPLVADTGLRQRMGHASRQRVRSFSLQRMVDDTTCIYQELIHRRDRNRSQRTADPVRP